MDEIKKLAELDEKQLDKAIYIFIDGFYNVMSSISKDKEALHMLFKKSFDFDMTYAYLQNGEAVGFLGLGDHQKRPIKLNVEIFMEIMGGFAGKVSYKAMSAAMEKPNVSSSEEIYIDYIAVAPELRGKGIGTKFLEYIRGTLGYKIIELEVFSKNPRAIKLYEREGFKVKKVKTDFMMILQGQGRRILMRLEAD
ncbi:MAG: GNAT family N-acetyltransferase [Clostridiales bacterium]|nr:GNAT family N-acetyltransferase [Clostridiales bacterium]